MIGQLKWYQGGLALGIVFFLAVWLMKPVGVSTQFVIFNGVVWKQFSNDLIQSGNGYYSSKNSYLNKSNGKYAKSVDNPLNYGFVFVFSIILGAFISSKTKGPNPSEEDRAAPDIWRSNYTKGRYIASFLSGVLVLYGARMAGGCTSGHMMSGMMQTSISGYLFAAAAFVIAIPCSIFILGRKS